MRGGKVDCVKPLAMSVTAFEYSRKLHPILNTNRAMRKL